MEDLSSSPRFQELVELVRQELNRLGQQRPSRSAGLREEKRQIELQISGWSRSLGRVDLDEAVRRSLEASWGQASRRIDEIDKELLAEEILEHRHSVVLDAQDVARQLARLHELLASNNATAVNFELSLHIDEIKCAPDGQVEMRTCKLGIAPDIVELLREAQTDSVPPSQEATEGLVVNRRRTRLANTGENRSSQDELMEFVLDPERFAGLPPQFFWIDLFQVPARILWPDEHADAVYRRKKEGGLSNAKLAIEFGVSIPTLRKALKIGQMRAESEDKGAA